MNKNKLNKRRLTFNPKNIEYLIDPFIDKELFKGAFYGIFNDRRYAPTTLIRLDKQSLEKVLVEISSREDVQRLQRTIDKEVSYGGRALIRLAEGIFNKVRLQKGLEGKLDIYAKEYQEITALCLNCENEAATGLFDSRIPEENIAFTPEQILYAKNLTAMFQDGILTCSTCGVCEFYPEMSAFAYVYRDMVGGKNDKNTEFEKRIRAIIKGMLNNLPNTLSNEENLEERSLSMESYIVDSFHKIFKSVKTGEQTNYSKLYKLFEWIRRENFDPNQLEWMGGEIRGELVQQIQKNVPLPYAVIRTRVKRKERMYEKFLQILYNLRMGKGRKYFDDLYGIRVILTKDEDCHELIPLLKNIDGFSIATDENEKDRVKDRITRPLKRAEGVYYRGIHVYLTDKKMIFEVQIKTHSMDREAETHPAIRHSDYLAESRKYLNRIPHQIRAVVANVIGVKQPLHYN